MAKLRADSTVGGEPIGTGSSAIVIGTATPDVTKTDTLWIDTGNNSVIKYSNGTSWIATGGASVSIGTTAPAVSKTDTLWIDTGNSSVIKYSNGSSWIATGATWK